MTVRFARHGSKPQMDPTPSPCEEEWTNLQPVAFEVGGLCCAACGGTWLEVDTHRHPLFLLRTARQTLQDSSCSLRRMLN